MTFTGGPERPVEGAWHPQTISKSRSGAEGLRGALQSLGRAYAGADNLRLFLCVFVCGYSPYAASVYENTCLTSEKRSCYNGNPG